MEIEYKTLKALEICQNFTGCDGCPYINNNDCGKILLKHAFELFLEYKAENEALLDALIRANECIDEVEDALRENTGNDLAMEAIEKYNGFCASESKDE